MIPIYFVLLGWKNADLFRPHTRARWRIAVRALPRGRHVVLREITELSGQVTRFIDEHVTESEYVDLGRLENDPEILRIFIGDCATKQLATGSNTTVLLQIETFRCLCPDADLVVCSGNTVRMQLNGAHLTLHDPVVLC
jgi:hypothetical protein